MAKRKKDNKTLWIVGGVAAAGIVGVILYERSSSASTTPVASQNNAAAVPSPGGGGSVGLSLPSPNLPIPSPNANTAGIALPDPFTGVSITPTPPAPPPVVTAPLVFTAPGAPHVISLALKSNTWIDAAQGQAYPAGTHIRMQVSAATPNFLSLIEDQVRKNTFGAWSVTVYPPGNSGPVSWPGPSGDAFRLEFILNKATVLNHAGAVFGAPQFWVLQ